MEVELTTIGARSTADVGRIMVRQLRHRLLPGSFGCMLECPLGLQAYGRYASNIATPPTCACLECLMSCQESREKHLLLFQCFSWSKLD